MLVVDAPAMRRGRPRAAPPATPFRARPAPSKGLRSVYTLLSFSVFTRCVVCTLVGMKKPMQFRLDVGLVARVDAARGGESRTAFLERALERLLESYLLPPVVEWREPVQRPGTGSGSAVLREKVRRLEGEVVAPAGGEVARVAAEVARVGPRSGGRGAHAAMCRCGVCLAAGRRAGGGDG